MDLLTKVSLYLLRKYKFIPLLTLFLVPSTSFSSNPKLMDVSGPYQWKISFQLFHKNDTSKNVSTYFKGRSKVNEVLKDGFRIPQLDYSCFASYRGYWVTKKQFSETISVSCTKNKETISIKVMGCEPNKYEFNSVSLSSRNSPYTAHVYLGCNSDLFD